MSERTVQSRPMDGRRSGDAVPAGSGARSAGGSARTVDGGPFPARDATPAAGGVVPGRTGVSHIGLQAIDAVPPRERPAVGRPDAGTPGAAPVDVRSIGDAPRLSTQEADARFDALVAQYRATKPRRARRGAGGLFATKYPFELVFLLGIAAGLVLHARPVIAFALGLPLFIVVRALLKRWGVPDAHDD